MNLKPLEQPSRPHVALLRLAGYGVLTAATAVGLWAIVETLVEGHIHEATTIHVPWGVWIALYLFFLGLSAGAYLVSTLPYVFGVRRMEPAGPMALATALVGLVAASLLILLDLGHPERMYYVLISLNSTSPMAWMGVLYTVYAAVIVAQMHFALRLAHPQGPPAQKGGRLLAWLIGRRAGPADEARLARDHQWLRRLGAAGLVVTVAVLGCEGAIFAVAKARPYWFGGLFPVVIMISAVASGAALLTLLTAAALRLERQRKGDLVRTMALLMVGMLALEALILITEVFTVWYGHIPHEAAAWDEVLWGSYAPVFWIFQIGLGLVLPVILVALPATANRPGWMGLAGLAALVGLLATRLNLVLPAQIVPVFPNLSEAYHHMRFEEGYFPSLGEWLVGVGVLAISIWLFLAIWKVLALGVASRPSAAQGRQ